MWHTWKNAAHLEKCKTLGKNAAHLGKCATVEKKRHTWINAPNLVDKLVINHVFKTLAVPLALVSSYWLVGNF